IEVTFDIDANGIVNVSAKDLATSKEQAMTITGGTALAHDDIDRMVKDAETHAEEDKQRREKVETRNQGDQLVHQTDKLLQEQGEQMTADEKSAVEAALGDLKGVLEDANAETAAIRSKMDALITASQAMATRLYQQASEQQAGAGSEGADSDEDIVEAEIVDEGDSE
ncbi:MAG: Hsp70 family protein, partial [Acidimicrobiia bacterium]|nr:Hsp70 family protein [Acidimicrobiia bacterium]